MDNTWILSVLLSIFIGVLPVVKLAFWLSFDGHINKEGGSKTALSTWYLGQRYTSLLLIICDLSKPVFTFVIIGWFFKNDTLAMDVSLLTALIGYYFKPFKIKATYSPLPLLGFLIVFSPLSALFLLFVYTLLLYFLRRPYISCIIFCLLTPVTVVVMATPQTPVTMVFVLPVLMLLSFYKKLSVSLSFKEQTLPPLF